jgi:hypothetical protein
VTLIKPKPGARLGLNDPLCHVKTTEELISEDSPRRENYRPEMNLYSQVKQREKVIPQTEEKPSRRKQVSTKQE